MFQFIHSFIHSLRIWLQLYPLSSTNLTLLNALNFILHLVSDSSNTNTMLFSLLPNHFHLHVLFISSPLPEPSHRFPPNLKILPFATSSPKLLSPLPNFNNPSKFLFLNSLLLMYHSSLLKIL